jgi:hypothetical protein
MRKALIPAFLLLLGSMVLGATVLREPLASAANPFMNVIGGNDASHPVPVQAQGTVPVQQQGTVTVSEPIQTQELLNQVVQNENRQTIDVSAYKTLQVYFDLVSGSCAGSGASLDVLETSDSLFLGRANISADDACKGSFTGETIDMPGRTLTFIPIIPNSGDKWRVVVFGRAN